MTSDYQRRALELVDSLKDRGSINNMERGRLRRAILENQRLHGKWELISLKGHITGKGYKCNVCGRIMTHAENFCPSCGMRGDLDD